MVLDDYHNKPYGRNPGYQNMITALRKKILLARCEELSG